MWPRMSIVLFIVLPSHPLQIPWVTNQNQNIHIDEIRKCANQGSGDVVWDLRLNRLSRQRVVLQGNISMTVPLNDKVAGGIVVAEKGNGGWIERGFVFKLPYLCRDLAVVLGSGWTSFWEKAGIAPPITCPIKKGNYTLKDFPTTDFGKHIFPGMKQGTFRVDLEFINQNQLQLGCIRFIVHV